MSNADQEATATASEIPVAPQNISPIEAIQKRAEEIRSRTAESPEPTEEVTEQPEAEAPEPTPEETEVPSQTEQQASEEVSEAPEATEETPSEPESVDWDGISDDNLDKLIARAPADGKSRLMKRLASLTKEKRQAEAAAQDAQKQFQEQQQRQQALLPSVPEKNPYESVNTPEEFQKAKQEAEQAEEWAQDVLDLNEHSSMQDVVVDEGGTQYTKAQIKGILKESKKAQKVFLPARINELQAENQLAQHKQKLDNQLKSEVDWLDDDESEAKVMHKSLMEGPLVAEIQKKVPQARAYLNYLMGHASTNIVGVRKPIAMEQTTKTPAVKPTQMKTPTTDAPPVEEGPKRKLKALGEKAKNTGSITDHVALRKAQIAKRFATQ